MRTLTDHKSLVWIGARPTEWVGAVNPMPADMAIGTTTVTFSGVHAGSEIRVYSPSGAEAAGVETCVDDQVLTWPYYGLTAANLVTVRIVNVAYKIKEFTYTATLGANTLPIQQERDPWYKNPI